MAKNSYKANVNQYANQEEAIRKAKGNPNKNIHSKKKNSNYGGYTTGAYMAKKVAEGEPAGEGEAAHLAECDADRGVCRGAGDPDPAPDSASRTAR